ncbi:MAG: efflux RND transporter periplasmic adaptor subunit [Alphaproteobacteria bacterium]
MRIFNVKIKGAYISAFLIAGLAGGWLLSGVITADDQPVTADGGDEATMAANLDADIPMPTVRTLNTVAQAFEGNLQFTGQSSPDRLIDIKAETEGTIRQFSPEIGDFIAVNETMLQINLATRQIELNQAKAALRQAEIEFGAAQKLAQKGFQSDIQKAKAETALAVAKTNLALIELDIARTSVTAPFDGRIYQKHVEIGDYVKVADNVVTLVDLDPLVVEIQISENDIGRVALDAQAVLEFQDKRRYQGRLKHISPVSDAQTRTFMGEIELDNPDHHLKAGLTVKAILDLPQISAHKISPAWLGLSDEGQIGLKAVDENEIVQFYPVEIASNTSTAVWVTGLPDQAEIIVVGQEFVSEGTKVIVQNITQNTDS